MDMNLIGSGGASKDPNSWKAIWSGPGSNFSKITAILALGGIGYGLFKALPFLIAGASNMIIFILECAALIGLILMLTSKSFWKCIAVSWRIATKKVLGYFVKIDPITILETGIEELRGQLDIVEEKVTDLGGVIDRMERKLVQYQNEFKDNKRRRDSAERMMNDASLSPEKLVEIKHTFALCSNKITRNEQAIVNQNKRIATATKFYELLKKMREMARFKVEDSEDQLSHLKEEYESAKIEMSVYNSVKAIMKGNPNGMEYDLAAEEVAATVSRATAQMKEFLDGSNDWLVNYDLETYANIGRVDEIIAKYDAMGFDAFTGKDGRSYNDNVVNVPYSEQELRKLDGKSPDYISKSQFSNNRELVGNGSNNGQQSQQKRYF